MNPRKNVLFINHSVRHGGPGKSLYYILKYIDREQLTPLVLVPKHDVFTEQMEEIGLAENVIVDSRFPENIMRPVLGGGGRGEGREGRRERSSMPAKALSIALNVIGIMWLLAASPFMIRKKKVELIYCNGTLAKIVGALMGLLNLRPVIWHVRNIQQKAPLRITMGVLARLGAVKRIICVSKAAALQFAHVSPKVRVINNGLDIEEFDPAGRTDGALRETYGLGDDVTVVGSTGRVVPRKGYASMIKAARVVKERLSAGGEAGGTGAGSVKFVIVGDTPHFFRINHLEELKRLTKEIGVDDMVVFTGYAEDVKPYLKEFDIFVIPSNYPDPFPRAVIEAMAFSLPVIGFKQGGIVESVEDGVTGVLLDPEGGGEGGAAECMAEAVLGLIRDEEKRARMGAAGRERVKSKFQARDIARKIEKEIMETLSA